MSQFPSFIRIGPERGREPELAPWPWNANDVVLTQGMTPTGSKTYDHRGVTLGIWACNAGAVEIQGHAVDEACFIIRGSVTLTDDDGRSETFEAGDGFLLLRGFRGTWSQSDDFAKMFVAISRA